MLCVGGLLQGYPQTQHPGHRSSAEEVGDMAMRNGSCTGYTFGNEVGVKSLSKGPPEKEHNRSWVKLCEPNS